MTTFRHCVNRFSALNQPLFFCSSPSFPSSSSSPLTLRLANNLSLCASAKASSAAKKNKTRTKFYARKAVMVALPAHKLFIWQEIAASASAVSYQDAEDAAGPRARRADERTGEPPEQRFLEFALELSSPSTAKTKRIYMKRTYDDLFARMRARLETKIRAFLKMDAEQPVQIIPLGRDGNPLAKDDVGLFDLFFGQNRCESLQIGDSEYAVVLDPAWLDKIEIALQPLVGCPVLPSCEWKNNNCADSTSGSDRRNQFRWFTTDKGTPLNIQIVEEDASMSAAAANRIRMEGWTHVHAGPFYTPTVDDLGKCLAVVADFGANAGVAEGVACASLVARADSPPEDEFIFTARQREHCAQRLTAGNNSYRLLSYNILADLYQNLKLEQKDLFFSYCPKQYLEPKYRYPILLRELDGYNADLMFLQEVDFRMQHRFLVPFLTSKGWTPFFNCKLNNVNEGLMIAFRNDRFRRAGDTQNFTTKLSDYLALPANADIMAYLERSEGKEKITQVVTTRPNIIQLIYLRTDDGHGLLCANTHLYFDPAFEEVKNIQALLCVRRIAEVLSGLDEPEKVRVLFAGDLNSGPDSGAISLLLGNRIQLDGTKTVTAGQNGMEVQSPLQFQCLSGFPPYTNFTRAEGVNDGFVGCLDYLFAHPPMRIRRVVPMPDHQLVVKYGALPSKVAPSDHLAIVCEAEFVDEEK